MIQFGSKDPGHSYLIRPGVYAITIKKPDIGIIQLPDNYKTLPGSGINYGESQQDALKREILEETGFDSKIHNLVGQAGQFISIPERELYLHKICYFYKVTLKDFIQDPSEPDHFFEWRSIENALEELFEESQVWAIRQTLE